MKSKFTPGPWTRINLTICTMRNKDNPNFRIARVFESGIETQASESTFQSTANADLISSAPDLYEACKRAFNWLHVIISDFEIKNPENKDALMGLQNFIYKALSKAEGKE